MSKNGNATTDAIRPQRLADVIGQSSVTEPLADEIKAAKSLDEPLDHVFLWGPFGLGKTSVALAAANELGADFTYIDTHDVRCCGDLVLIFKAAKERQVLFFDECELLSVVRGAEEVLHPALEDFRLNLRAGSERINPCTVIFATTREDRVSAALRSRFGLDYQFHFYSTEDLIVIVGRVAKIWGVSIDYDARAAIASCGKGTPRIAIARLRRARAFAEAHGHKAITLAVANEALSRNDIGNLGLDAMDRKYLRALLPKDVGEPRPIGLKALAAALNANERTLQERVEPYLHELGLFERKPNGRKATKRTYEYLKMELPLQWRPSKWK